MIQVVISRQALSGIAIRIPQTNNKRRHVCEIFIGSRYECLRLFHARQSHMGLIDQMKSVLRLFSQVQAFYGNNFALGLGVVARSDSLAHNWWYRTAWDNIAQELACLVLIAFVNKHAQVAHY